MSGAILWRGTSRLDRRSRIVAIATGLDGESDNPKTGPMVQTWIILEDEAPQEAVRSGAARAVCGSCPLRAGACYVATWQAPRAVWDAYHRGVYTDATEDPASAGDGRTVRLGSYGDPAAVPWRVWDALLSRARSWTGYTHQWRHQRAQGLQLVAMASVESVAGAMAAQALGFRTFRVLQPDDKPSQDEILCPASAEAGHRTTCAQCTLCSGMLKGAARNVAIYQH